MQFQVPVVRGPVLTRYPMYVRQRVMHLKRQGHTLKSVAEQLCREGFNVRYDGVRRVWQRFVERAHLHDEHRSGRVDWVDREFPIIKRFIHASLLEDNELTAAEIQTKLDREHGN